MRRGIALWFGLLFSLAGGSYALANHVPLPPAQGSNMQWWGQSPDLVGTDFEFQERNGRTYAFVGLERVVGSVGGRSGSFVLQRIGADEDGVVKETYSVVPGSGTGELQGLRGTGSASLGEQADRYPFTLDYDFE